MPNAWVSGTFTREERLKAVEVLLVRGVAEAAHLRSDLGALELLDPSQVCFVTASGQCHRQPVPPAGLGRTPSTFGIGQATVLPSLSENPVSKLP